MVLLHIINDIDRVREERRREEKRAKFEHWRHCLRMFNAYDLHMIGQSDSSKLGEYFARSFVSDTPQCDDFYNFMDERRVILERRKFISRASPRWVSIFEADEAAFFRALHPKIQEAANRQKQRWSEFSD